MAASFVTSPKEPAVADSVGFALAPDTGNGKRPNRLRAWALGIPAGTRQATLPTRSAGAARHLPLACGRTQDCRSP